MLPVAFCYAGAHSASVFSFSAGSVSFGQIVKAAEPAVSSWSLHSNPDSLPSFFISSHSSSFLTFPIKFAAVLSQFVYNKPVSKAKWLCLPIVIGGVILASVNELDFAWSALLSACLANTFAAVRGNENKKLMETEGLKDRLGSVGNQFCITSILGFLLSIPFVLWKEGGKLGQFVESFKTIPALRNNMIASALWFYGYNELSTMTLKKTNAVTQSVANTAKRVIVIVGVALVLGESLDFMKLLGCGIGIGGVFLCECNCGIHVKCFHFWRDISVLILYFGGVANIIGLSNCFVCQLIFVLIPSIVYLSDSIIDNLVKKD